MKTLPSLLLLSLLSLSLQAQTLCDSLSYKMEYSAFDDSILSVSFVNKSSDFFSGPSFYLIENNGDTIAKQVSGSFGIGAKYTAGLDFYPGKNTLKNFAARREIWTAPNDSLICSYNDTISLCQIVTCVNIYPGVANFGGALVDGTIEWNVFRNGANLGSGDLVLVSPMMQQVTDSICLSPNKYRFEFAASGPLGGQLYGQVSSDDELSFYSQSFNGFAGIIDVDIYKQCRPAANAIPEVQLNKSDFSTLVLSRKLYVQSENYPFGLEIKSLNGQSILKAKLEQPEDFIDLSELSSGIYLVQHESHLQKIFVD